MATRMQQRRGTSAQWTNANPVLAAGEIGFETDTNQFKMGDGVNTWTNLAYFVDEDSVSGSLGDYVELALLGVADGVATLDSNGFVPASQLDIDLTGYATETYVNTAVTNLVDAAPAALDTLNELAAALGDDANFATTVTNSIATKQDDVITTEGDLAIGDNAGTAVRLPIGPADTVLTSNGTTATWSEAGGGGDATWTELSNTTVTTGVSSYTVSGLSEYDKFAVIIRNFKATDGYAPYSLSFNGQSNLYGTRTQMRQMSNSNIDFSTSSSTSLSFSQGSTSTVNNNGTFFFVGSKGASPVFYSFNGGAASTANDNYTFFGSGALGKTASISEFTISVAGGATFTDGTLIIYGA